MNIEVFLQIFLWFKFGTSVQICIYLPTFVLIYTLCNRCCPTERYIRTVRIPGDLWFDLLDLCWKAFECLATFRATIFLVTEKQFIVRVPTLCFVQTVRIYLLEHSLFDAPRPRMRYSRAMFKIGARFLDIM